MDLTHFLTASRAHDAFKADVLAFAAGASAERIRILRPNPHVKVQRLLAKLLHEERDLAITGVTVDGWSGCSDFTGSIAVECDDELRRYEFTWCCRWRAQQEGWTDYFGFPDQIRAAHEFGWDCFARWEALAQRARVAV
ncbi:MAG TPA: hypothetical protein VFS05_07980 [Gemmatimonadaceae bacterium]|nr:hypothetical protein [Gemmatimonadaceae bacterium]